MGWIQRLFKRGRLERELDKELRYHLERRVADLVAEGIEPREAARRARLEFGGTDVIKEECRDERGTRWLEDFIQDCRYGLRLLRRSPVFTSIAILSLALGIGANTAIFSLMDRMMFRMLPVHEPERLAEIGQGLSYPLFQDLKRSLTSFEGLLARSVSQGDVQDIFVDGQAETARFEMASGSYYSLLGVPALIGRTFTEEVDRVPGGNPVAVISHDYWERRFESDPAAIGKTFRRLDTVFTIIGVTPPEFFGTVVGRAADITVPLTMDAEIRGEKSWQSVPSTWWLSVMGRLKPGVGIEQARAEVHTVLTAVATYSPSDKSAADLWILKPGATGFDDLGKRFGKPLAILMGTVALVLLLACANLANLLLAKSAVRQREIAVRLAVGARRGRVIRQLLAEGLLLALMGGVMGVVLAYAFAERLVTMMSNYGPRMALDVTPDGRVLLFAVAASVVACVLFSLAPALLATRQSFQPALAEIRASRWRLGKGLVVAQMAISVLLLIGAGLFGRTLINLYAQNPGFDENDVVLFSTNAGRLGYPVPRLHQLNMRVVAELKTLPGVESASVSAMPPISGAMWGQRFIVEGGAPPEDKNLVSSLINTIGPDFFRTLRSPMIAGREFNARDTESSPRVAIVDQAFAKHHFQESSPLGKWLAFSEHPEERFEIVGVVRGFKYRNLRQNLTRTVFLPATQVPADGVEANTFFLRTTAGLATIAPSVEAILKRSDSTLLPVNLSSLETHVAKSVLQERMLATLAGFFGALALLLGTIGIYGVMAFQVARRRREIGIRMALGADARTVIGMILGQTARLTLLGCAIGAAGGLALTGVAAGILYEVRPNDPGTFGVAIAGLLLIALLAAYLPGRSAARTNPVETLRGD